MKKNVIIILIIFAITITFFIIYKQKQEQKILKTESKIVEETVYSSNIIKNVNYSSKDSKGNEYIIFASEGEIDYAKPNEIFLTDVRAIIKLTNSNEVTIVSKFGKYNTINFDTIFSKSVIIKYLLNEIQGEYLDFSLSRNSLIMSRDVVYTNLNNILKADIIEMEIDTKNSKISMFENDKKVNIKSKK